MSPLEHAIEEAEGDADDVTLTQLFTRNLTRALMVGSIPATIVLGMTTAAWIVSAVPPIRAAAAATYTAENDYIAALKQSQPLMTALSDWGTPVATLESAWFAFAEAPPTERAETGDRLMSVLVDQVQDVRSVRGDEASDLVLLLSDATRARRRASDAWHDWSDRTSSMRGRMAVLTGLADMPPAELARYDQPLPQGRSLPMK
jgi:hypothetical protein